MATYIDPRGAEYGLFEISRENELYAVTHSADGYTLSIYGAANFEAWKRATGLRDRAQVLCLINETHDCSESVRLIGSKGAQELDGEAETLAFHLSASDYYDLKTAILSEVNKGETSGENHDYAIRIAWEVIAED